MRRSARGHVGSEKGFTLIELMIALALGLVVIGSVVSIMLANTRTYRSNEAVSQLQESARTAFELLARDARQAGASGCDSNARIANVLRVGTNPQWWQNWFGLVGYDNSQTDPAVAIGTGAGARVSGTDSIALQNIEGTGLSVKSNDAVNAKFVLNAASTSITAGDVLMVCDFDHATLFQVSSYNGAASAVEVSYVNGVGTPGNCSKGLGYPTNCGTATGNAYPFSPNSQIARFTAVDWYIGNNNRPADGGRSLYRRRLGSGGVLVTEEVVAGVTDMQIKYRVSGTNSFVDANEVAAANWKNVNALAITLMATSSDQRVSTAPAANSGRLQRPFTWLVTLRNRVP